MRSTLEVRVPLEGTWVLAICLHPWPPFEVWVCLSLSGDSRGQVLAGRFELRSFSEDLEPVPSMSRPFPTSLLLLPDPPESRIPGIQSQQARYTP